MSKELKRVEALAEAARKAQKAYAAAVVARNEAIADALAAGEAQIPIAAAGQVSQATVSRIERKGAEK